MRQALFGRPVRSFEPGGTHISVYLIPVFDRQVVAFDVQAKQAEGRWLPWDVLPWRGNPYAAASELADVWCSGDLEDLRLVDVLSHETPGDGWELALVFRAALTAMPPGDDHRSPVQFPLGALPPIRQFAPVDLERWAAEPAQAASAQPSQAGGLLF